MWLSANQAQQLAAEHGTPTYIYSREALSKRADELLGLKLPFGHTVRYAIKANPHPEIIKLFAARGVQFDASSSYEAAGLIDLGISGDQISLSSQQPAHNLKDLLAAGVKIVATSRHQLALLADAAGEGSAVALRVNPGVGDGHSNRTNTGGVNSSFGLWHEYLEDALAFAATKKIRITRLHVHIGSGADKSVWANVMDVALKLVERMPDVTTLDIGGGYKVSRTDTEHETDMTMVASVFAERLQAFATETGRKLHLEIEPGTWLVAHAGVLLSEVTDIVDTGADGYTFLRINTGMNDILRPALYGAQHQITVLNDATEQIETLVAGHCCETSDLLTPAPYNPEEILPRLMNKANIGDIVMIADVGAYCAALSAKGYNAFPAAKEVLL
ncbi:MAG TPA: diaminopimelate decarboxylase [Candidatus Saccharimonadales bacterium]|nr:diaminopimelate decarboxylase [Candidatus Saccharimonadales bacterium]